jgi:NAD(P)-dependent dehydrogenase (short-subunit alcohol dehydrogenase family)
VAPGWVITERQQALWVTPETLRGHIDRQCLKEAMQPHDMVGPCLFLASDAAAMLTAQTIIVDGGVM